MFDDFDCFEPCYESDEWKLHDALSRVEKEGEPYIEVSRNLSNALSSCKLHDEDRKKLEVLYAKYSAVADIYESKMDRITAELMNF